MAKDDFPATPAIRFLREHGIAFTPRLYAYEDLGERGARRRSWAWTSTSSSRRW